MPKKTKDQIALETAQAELAAAEEARDKALADAQSFADELAEAKASLEACGAANVRGKVIVAEKNAIIEALQAELAKKGAPAAEAAPLKSIGLSATSGALLLADIAAPEGWKQRLNPTSGFSVDVMGDHPDLEPISKSVGYPVQRLVDGTWRILAPHQTAAGVAAKQIRPACDELGATITVHATDSSLEVARDAARGGEPTIAQLPGGQALVLPAGSATVQVYADKIVVKF